MTCPDCHCISLRKASRRLTAVYDGAMAPFGITITQFSELRNIQRLQPVSLSELAEKLELDRSTIGRNVKVLQRLELVETTDGEDRRQNALRLTPKAADLLKEAAPAWDAVQAKVEEAMPQSVLLELCDRLETL
ncbi:MarR family winged helix-turn-helix transcriptional regulator [Rhizobium halophytocola]|uniref:DNA-binding MarR family transcriptional regulator n=1 Tax=Rhizobium halophytocola TaxID=735519 RepID=A0ABS4DY71_9HYPH|nr:MarR family winged helix-turn-helix transcriptional regulator [Rhizobium halophytocola]MBP1850643.1 DNA-binding MarR family transcriptional regulator [Rhizobium halophytocola]